MKVQFLHLMERSRTRNNHTGSFTTHSWVGTMNVKFLTKKFNKLNGLPGPKVGEKRTPHKKDGVANIYLAQEAADATEAQANPPSECLSLAAEVRKYVKLETKFGARAPETLAQLDVLAPLVVEAKPGLLSLLLRQERS